MLPRRRRIDRLHDAILRAQGRRIECPVTVLWASGGHLGGWYDPRQSWQPGCARRVDGGLIQAGPHLAEEAPDDVAAWFERVVREPQSAVA